MRGLRELFRRELRSWLWLPSYYLAGMVFLGVTGLSFWTFAASMAGRGMLTSEITFCGTLFWMAFLAVASAISVRLLGDEQERGTLELLLTAPVTEAQIILSKAAAGVPLILLLGLPAVVYPWLLRLLNPGWKGADLAMWLSGVLLVCLVAGLMTVMGLFWSQVLRRQVLAMVATFLSGALIVFRGSLRSWIGGGAAEGSAGLVAVASHVSSFAAGMIDSRFLVFYVSAAAMLVFLNVRLLQLARNRRVAGGVNVAVSFVLALLLAALVNYLALLHPFRIDIGTLGRSPLSSAAAKTLDDLKSPARLVLLAAPGEATANTARRVVEKYRHVNPRLQVDLVDPGSDLGRTRDLVAQYKIRESNVLIVSCGRHVKVLPLRSLERATAGGLRPGQRGSTFSSLLESDLLSALRAVSREATPIVYFMTGHDERGLNDFADYRGYSEIAGIVRDLQAETRPLLLGAASPISNDCSVLVVAGPARSLAAWEVVKIRDYVARGGRLMLLLDSGSEVGLEGFLAEWGVRLGRDRVVDSPTSAVLTGSRERSSALGLGEVPVIRYGQHPVAGAVEGLMSTFVMPRSVVPLSGNGGRGSLSDHVDKPRVTELAYSSESSWAETDFEQNPPQFDEGYDGRGPVPVAVAVEKGMSSEITMDIKPFRMVVVGDSQFAANRCLAGGNQAFFLGAMDWLLERDRPPLAVAAQGGLYDLVIPSGRRPGTFTLVVLMPPALLLLCLGAVRLARRDRRPRVMVNRKGGGGL